MNTQFPRKDIPHNTPAQNTPAQLEKDIAQMQQWLSQPPDIDSVAHFVPGPGIQKLQIQFDIGELRQALQYSLTKINFKGQVEDGFGAFSLTRRPGMTQETANDLSGLFWTRVDDTYQEVQREEAVNEYAFTEFVSLFSDTYFKYVHEQLRRLFTIGRMRVLSKELYNCNSWHRDPEPRLHIPIISNPGSLFAVNHHITHLPADGSVYFTDTRGYHTALNGGETHRTHIVAALPC